MKFTIDGLDKLQTRLKTSEKNAVRQLGRGVFVEAQRIMTTSKRDFVPVDQGTLKASGHVDPPTVRSKTVEVVLGYGGAAAAYALVQHERTDFKHTVGQSKFLEKPVRAARSGFSKRVAKNLELF